jgi:hypothetical protein
LDPWQGPRICSLIHPLPRIVAQLAQPNPSMRLGEVIELGQTRSKQRPQPAPIPASVMMKRGSKLNQPLKEGLLGLERLEPRFLPNLVGFEELARVEESDPTPKFFTFSHRLPVELPLKFFRDHSSLQTRKRPWKSKSNCGM